MKTNTTFVFATHKKFLIFAIFLILFPMIFTACKYNIFDLDEKEKITCNLPDWPTNENLPQLSCWLVQIVGTDVEIDDISLSSFLPEYYFTTENKISIKVEKNQPAAIIATPVNLTPEGNEVTFFKPAGMIYPFEEKLSWQGGYSASVFQLLYNSKKESGVTNEHMNDFLSKYNWKKLTESLAKKQSESEAMLEDENSKNTKFYNPWQIDIYTLLENISYANFKSTLNEPKNIVSIKIEKCYEDFFENLVILSSYVPENECIRRTGKISIKKNEQNYLMLDSKYSLIITYISSKNISKELCYMPIFNKEI